VLWQCGPPPCPAPELDNSGEVVYLNGAIGAQIGPNGPVWEVSDAFPLTGACRGPHARLQARGATAHAATRQRPGAHGGPGDGTAPPPGATLLPRNFRSAFLIGQQLAIAVRPQQARVLGGTPRLTSTLAPGRRPRGRRQVNKTATPHRVPPSPIDYRHTRVYTEMTNPLVIIGKACAARSAGDGRASAPPSRRPVRARSHAGGAPAGTCPKSAETPDVPLMMGYAMREAFVCHGEPSDATCVSDNYACTVAALDPLRGLTPTGSTLWDGTTLPQWRQQAHGQLAVPVPMAPTLGAVGTAAPPPQSNRELLRLAGIHLCDRDASDPQCADADGADGGGARIRLPMRVGRYIQMPLAYARLGPVRLVALPGEFSPELVIGVPDDFDAPDAVGRYYERPERHVVGAAYTFPGTSAPGCGRNPNPRPC